MGGFILGKMTFGSLFKKPETTLYPFEQKTPHPNQKGHVEIDSSDCILCGICQKRCPCGAITVDKAASTWNIDPFRCVQCISCVYACPKGCLTMDSACSPVSPTKTVTTVTVEKKSSK